MLNDIEDLQTERNLYKEQAENLKNAYAYLYDSFKRQRAIIIQQQKIIRFQNQPKAKINIITICFYIILLVILILKG